MQCNPRVLILVLMFLSFNLFASTNYNGSVAGRVDETGGNKYGFYGAIELIDGEMFDATIKLFITSPNDKSNQVTAISSNEIGLYKVNGDLNPKNEYHFIDDGKHNFYLKIEIDKLFSIEEKKARLFKKQASSE